MSTLHSDAASGFKASAARAATGALALLRTRLELASLELAEERERLFVRLGLLFAAVLLMVFGVLGLGVMVAVYFWDTQREAAVLVPTALCIVSGWGLFRMSKGLGASQGLPFAATLAEFDKDRAAFSDPPMARAQTDKETP
ncbi:MAG: hypothetical protein RIR09_857 [Pseudomonadota bacterium]|jgi:uncharacterized membrane protein YqjE